MRDLQAQQIIKAAPAGIAALPVVQQAQAEISIASRTCHSQSARAGRR
jgi:hypothetical protein